MKVWTSKYRSHWLSPYTILKRVCFWEKNDDVFYDHCNNHKAIYGRWVKILNPICEALQKFLDKIHPRIEYVKIDYWDCWSLDHTLADIILPALKQLRNTKHGSPFVDDEDVPPHLQSEAYKKRKKKLNKRGFGNEVHSIDDEDSTLHDRWDWVLSEMIWAFEQKVDDESENKFWDHSGDRGMPWSEDYIPPKCDWSGLKAHQERKSNGFRLFGKYYEALWD